MMFFHKTKPEKRLLEIRNRIQDTEVGLLAARLNAATAESHLQILKEAEAKLMEEYPNLKVAGTDCALPTN